MDPRDKKDFIIEAMKQATEGRMKDRPVFKSKQRPIWVKPEKSHKKGK